MRQQTPLGTISVGKLRPPVKRTLYIVIAGACLIGLYWLKNSAEFASAPAFSKNGDF